MKKIAQISECDNNASDHLPISNEEEVSELSKITRIKTRTAADNWINSRCQRCVRHT